MANEEWGPLAALIGDWEGTAGLDVAFSHERNQVWETPFSEKVTMKPFGPVQNGSQTLFGLDYKTAMWRGSEENPFHTEVGYWLWDSATDEVVKGFLDAGGSGSVDELADESQVSGVASGEVAAAVDNGLVQERTWFTNVIPTLEHFDHRVVNDVVRRLCRADQQTGTTHLDRELACIEVAELDIPAASSREGCRVNLHI